MTRKLRLTKNESGVRRGQESSRASTKRANRAGTKGKRPRSLNLGASADPKSGLPLSSQRIADFYRPLKKPVTLRLDADVLAWFKKDGRRYQTRINTALRKVMEREMKGSR
jgi:uncharacterized protein (DUF4415 family)